MQIAISFLVLLHNGPVKQQFSPQVKEFQGKHQLPTLDVSQTLKKWGIACAWVLSSIVRMHQWNNITFPVLLLVILQSIKHIEKRLVEAFNHTVPHRVVWRSS